MKHGSIFLLLLIVVSLLSCGRQTAGRQEGGDTVCFRYAQRLSVVRYDGYAVATLANPWKEGMTLHRYVLVPKGAELPADMPHGTLVRTPLQRSVVFTTVHCSLLQMLHREQAVAGVADLKYIKLPFVQRGVEQGSMVDVGEGMSPVIEKIIDLEPDALLLSPFENSGGYGRLEDINIPIIECAEYMEASPLARAEWMRFYGMLYGCEREADSLFAVVDSSYHALKAMAESGGQTAGSRQAAEAGGGSRQAAEMGGGSGRSCVLDKVTGSVWYVPGGRSTIGQMISDAGGRYPWAADDHSGSVSLPFEAVLERAGDSEVWLFRYSSDHPISYRELLAEHRGYNQFRAFYEQQAYGCNVELSLFYEESPFRPDFLLSDFLQILHPELQQKLPPLRYYHKL